MNAGKRFTVRVLIAPIIFVVLGPAVGVMLFLALGERAIFDAAVFFVVVGAYVMMGKACIVAGLFYSGICLCLWRRKPNEDVGGLASILIGSVAGMVGIAFRLLTIYRSPPEIFATAWLIAPGMLCGAVCAACGNLILEVAGPSKGSGDAGVASPTPPEL